MMTLTWDYDNELAFPNQVFWDGPLAGTGIADTSRGCGFPSQEFDG